MLINKR